MCNSKCIYFGVNNLSIDELHGKRIIEVGSHDVNGSLRPIIEAWGKPKEYVGVDIEKGPGVDVVCRVEELITTFGKDCFDIVISTEMLEHILNWRDALANIKLVCKPDGIILLTTRSKGFPYHGHPYDFWRFELEDIKYCFSDCDILAIENDPQEPGVFLKAKKPTNFTQKNLKEYSLYSIVVDQRVSAITDADLAVFHLIQKLPINRWKKKPNRFLFKLLRSLHKK